MPLRVTAICLCLAAAIYLFAVAGAGVRHWVSAAQPPAACSTTMGGRP